LIRPNNSLIQGSVFCELGNNLGLGVGLNKFNAFDEIIAKVHVHLTEQYPNTETFFTLSQEDAHGVLYLNDSTGDNSCINDCRLKLSFNK